MIAMYELWMISQVHIISLSRIEHEKSGGQLSLGS
jgi:hypothetical protein